MKHILLIIFLLPLYVCSCKSESEKTLDKFNRINESLKHLNTDTTFRTIYGRISEKRSDNPHLCSLVDSLNSKLQIVNIFLDSLIFTIEANDTTGERTDFVSTRLIGTETGDELIEKTHLIYRYAIDKSSHQASKNKIESFFKKYQGLFGTTEFLHLIDKTPSLAVITILSGVKVDCMKAAIICARDIEVRLN